jgi:hypothetical protein
MTDPKDIKIIVAEVPVSLDYIKNTELPMARASFKIYTFTTATVVGLINKIEELQDTLDDLQAKE